MNIGILKDTIQRHKVIINNFSFLSILQLFNLIIPLVTYPYLIRIMGKDLYGVIIYAVSLSSYFSIVVNFGFNIYATKYVAIYRDNKKKLSELVSCVLIVKILLFFICLIVYLLLVFIVPDLRANSLLYIFSFLICISEVVFPIWYFQGIENMKYITYINVISRTLFTVLVFIVIKKETDFLYVPIFQFLGAFIGGMVALWIVFKQHAVRLFIPQYNVLKKYVIESFPFFLSRASGVINTESNTIIIGLFLSMGEVAYYDLAKKIVTLLLMPYNLLNQALYPSVAKSKNMYQVKQILKFNFILGIAIYLGVVVFGKIVISLIGGVELMPAYDILIIMALIIPINGITYFLGNTVLVVMGYSKYFNMSVVYAMFFYLITLAICIISIPISLYLFSCMFVVVGIFDLFYRGYYVRKFKLLEV